jgi:subtilisin family serine protease
MEIPIKLGGKKLKLKEAEKEFSILKNSVATAELLNKKDIQSVTQAAPGIQLVTASNSETRDLLMDEIRKTGISHHVYEISDEKAPKRFIITDKVNIKFKENIPLKDQEDLLRQYHLQYRKKLAPNLYSCQVTNETRMNPIKLCSKLEEDIRIEYIEPDFVIENKLFELITDTVTSDIQDNLLKESWHLNEVDVPFVSEGSDIKAKEAWTITKGDPEIIIAVMDDGFDLTNPDLKNKVKFPSDFTRTEAVSGDPSNILPDDDLPLPEKINGRRDYHGTPCAGLAVASEGQGQIIGVAPGCSFMPVRWNVGESTQDLVLEIFNYISKRADIVSCSWGTLPHPWGFLSSTAHDTINEISLRGGRRGKGLVICFAAGNDDLPTFMSKDENAGGLEYYHSLGEGYPPGVYFQGLEIHGGWTEIDGVIVVSSYTSRKRKSLYSNWGPNITVSSPSDNWHPVGPQTRKKYNSVNLVTTDNENHGSGLFEVGLSKIEEGYVTHGMGGTSGATPIVAGVCGLMLSINPNLTAKRVKQILEETTDKVDVDFTLDDTLFNNKNRDGHFSGLNKHSIYFGYGRINAGAAVTRAKQEIPI